jgi:hypothetical protein
MACQTEEAPMGYWKFFSSSPPPNWFYSPLCLLPNGYSSVSKSVLRDPKGTKTSLQGMRGYIPVMATLKFT